MKKLTCLFILLIISVNSTYSQNIKNEYSLSCDSACHIYNTEMHTNDYDIVIGREYKIYHNYKKGNPYLNSRQGKGIIYSKGYAYENKIILYDMFLDEIAVNTSFKNSSNTNVKLQKVKIDSFSIEFHNQHYHFIHFKSKSSGANQISSGFYEIPYIGKYQLLFKYTAEKGEAKDGTTEYRHKILHFLKINNSYFNIDSRKRFLALFKNHKTQIKKKMRSWKGRYKTTSPAQLIELIKYAETL